MFFKRKSTARLLAEKRFLEKEQRAQHQLEEARAKRARLEASVKQLRRDTSRTGRFIKRVGPHAQRAGAKLALLAENYERNTRKPVRRKKTGKRRRRNDPLFDFGF